MGLFNFSKPDASAGQDIVLIVNEDQVSVPASEATGLTVAQLFNKFASTLCDTNRINRYINQGRIVQGTAPALEGTIYSAAIASESKG